MFTCCLTHPTQWQVTLWRDNQWYSLHLSEIRKWSVLIVSDTVYIVKLRSSGWGWSKSLHVSFNIRNKNMKLRDIGAVMLSRPPSVFLLLHVFCGCGNPYPWQAADPGYSSQLALTIWVKGQWNTKVTFRLKLHSDKLKIQTAQLSLQQTERLSRKRVFVDRGREPFLSLIQVEQGHRARCTLVDCSPRIHRSFLFFDTLQAALPQGVWRSVTPPLFVCMCAAKGPTPLPISTSCRLWTPGAPRHSGLTLLLRCVIL